MSVAEKLPIAMFSVDRTRLVPTNIFPDGIRTTVGFRGQHIALRETWLSNRAEIKPRLPAYEGKVPFEPDRLKDLSEAELDALVRECAIDHPLPAAAEFPATTAGLEAHLNELREHVAPNYAASRNNASLPFSTSRLSPYLRFGIVSPHAVMRIVHSLTAPAFSRWKFFDELLRWREWAHYRAKHNPHPHLYSELLERARKTMDDHRCDPRTSTHTRNSSRRLTDTKERLFRVKPIC